MIGLFVTGTDTGVGKTTVTCALLAAARARGLRVAAMKPVETGCADWRRMSVPGSGWESVSSWPRTAARACCKWRRAASPRKRIYVKVI